MHSNGIPLIFSLMDDDSSTENFREDLSHFTMPIDFFLKYMKESSADQEGYNKSIVKN